MKPVLSRAEFPKDIENMNNFSLYLSSEINPSEDPDKILKAIMNLFPLLELKMKNKEILGFSKDPDTLKELCHKIYSQQILDAARNCVLDGRGSNDLEEIESVEFFLNKQVAYYDKVAFTNLSDAPMGPIKIKIISDKIIPLIDNYFPKFEWFKESKE